MLDDIEYIGTKRACYTISSTPSRSASPGIRMIGTSRAVTGFTLTVLNEGGSNSDSNAFTTSLSKQKSNSKDPHRLITFHNSSGCPWDLRSSDIVVGRSPPVMTLNGSTAMFRCPVVSRQHATFYFWQRKLFLCDTSSHHGTHLFRPGVYLTSEKLTPNEPVQVYDGDVITFGKTVRNKDLVKPVIVRVALSLASFMDDAMPQEVATKTPLTPITPATRIPSVGGTSPKSGTGRYGVFSPSSSEAESGSSGSSSDSEHSDEMDISSDSSMSDDDEVEEISAPKPVHAGTTSVAYEMVKNIGEEGANIASPSPAVTSTPTTSRWDVGGPPPEPAIKPPPQPPTPPSSQPRAPFVFGSLQPHTPFTFGLGLGMDLPRFFDSNGPGGSASAASISRDVDQDVPVMLPPLNFGSGEEEVASVFGMPGSPSPQSPFVNPAASGSAPATPPSFSFGASSSSPTLERLKRIQKQMKLNKLFSMSSFKGLSSSIMKGRTSRSRSRSRSKSPMSMSISESASVPPSPTAPTMSFPEEHTGTGTGMGTDMGTGTSSSIQCAQPRDVDVDVDVDVGVASIPVPISDCYKDMFGFGLPWRADDDFLVGEQQEEVEVFRDKGKGRATSIDVDFENRGAEDVDEDGEGYEDDVEFVGIGQNSEVHDSVYTPSVLARGAQLLPTTTATTTAAAVTTAPVAVVSASTPTPAPIQHTEKVGNGNDDATAEFIKAQSLLNDTFDARLDSLHDVWKGAQADFDTREKKMRDLIQTCRTDTGTRMMLQKVEESFDNYRGETTKMREDLEGEMKEVNEEVRGFRSDLVRVRGRLSDVEDQLEAVDAVKDQLDGLVARMEGVEKRALEVDDAARNGIREVRDQMAETNRRVEGMVFDGEVWKVQVEEGKKLVEEMKGAFERMQTEHRHLSEVKESLEREMRATAEMRTRMEGLEDEWKAAIKSQAMTRLPLKRKRTDSSDDDDADDEDEQTLGSKRLALDVTPHEQVANSLPVSVPAAETDGDTQMLPPSPSRRSRIGRKIARTATTLAVGAVVTWTALAFS